MIGLLAKKIGMTQIFGKEGEVIPVTVLEAGPCPVVLKRTREKDGYNALQLGFGKAKKEDKPRYLKEFRVENLEEFNPAQEIKVDLFKPEDRVKVTGISIGKGFAGTVKRWHFRRSPMTHGSKSHRIPGSIGSGTTPGHVVKGKKMAGRLGGERVTVKNLRVVEVKPERNLLLLKGAVPGPKNSLVVIQKV